MKRRVISRRVTVQKNDKENALELFSPAKVNLMLSIHGRRADGFHELTSLIAAVDFGDRLTIRRSGAADADRLSCADPAVPVGAENLVLKAAETFRRRSGQAAYFDFELDKRIPMGAGLGGGSGNAAVALIGMNRLCGEPLDGDALREAAAELGSDCAFFIDPRPAYMRGRGERIEVLPEALAARLRGRRLALFRPHFAVETAGAYSRLASGAPEAYESAEAAAGRLEKWAAGGSLAAVLANSFEKPIGEKYLAISTLLDELRALGAACLMSGSGSCCFALLDENGLCAEAISARVRDAWGDSVFWVETSIT